MIRLFNVRKVYSQGKNEVFALAGVSLNIPQGEFAVIMGPSGSGKSTLLHLMGGLDRPTEGEVMVAGRIISQMSDNPVTLFRRQNIGFIFQFFNLLPTLTALENVMLPLILDKQLRAKARERAEVLLERVGLSQRRDHLPEELSGGENQRLAIARSLVFSPPILLADEPTGNLDSKTGETILELIRRVNQEEGCTVVMVTHNPGAAEYGNRVIHLSDGLIEEESRS
ncbi:MAG: ABC transporter ATP-binding protein [Deltaproteobacteria bacterium]|nr:ABC transporter ATP-binding protein [Deltaproteobacteria bacterium]